jgi:creatinine amidohydrolase
VTDDARPQPRPLPGVFLAEMTWPEAERRLRPDTVVVIPLGAASKEHGPHLPLNTDQIQAGYLARRVAERAEVVVAPTVTYSFYPAFVEYPGSTTLRRETARDLIVDTCRSLAAFGPRRFYVLNTGISTLRPLADAAAALASDGVLLRVHDPRAATAAVERSVLEQPRGTHADEAETSKMLFIAPEKVDMTKAVADIHPETPAGGGLTRDPTKPGVYSPTGTWGDPTLATPEKGRRLVETEVESILQEIEQLRQTPLPGTAGE